MLLCSFVFSFSTFKYYFFNFYLEGLNRGYVTSPLFIRSSVYFQLILPKSTKSTKVYEVYQSLRSLPKSTKSIKVYQSVFVNNLALLVSDFTFKFFFVFFSLLAISCLVFPPLKIVLYFLFLSIFRHNYQVMIYVR